MIIAGTGHRPKFLPCKYNENHPWLAELKKKIKSELERIAPSIVISGVAIGFDTWLAEVALELDLELFCYVPFPEQGQTWPAKSQAKLKYLISKATHVKTISQNYSSDVFLKRDRAMVNDADIILALWNPELATSGTGYTVKYAEQTKKEVINLWQ